MSLMASAPILDGWASPSACQNVTIAPFPYSRSGGLSQVSCCISWEHSVIPFLKKSSSGGMQEIIRSVRQLLRVLAPELVSNSGPSCQERKEGGLSLSFPPNFCLSSDLRADDQCRSRNGGESRIEMYVHVSHNHRPTNMLKKDLIERRSWEWRERFDPHSLKSAEIYTNLVDLALQLLRQSLLAPLSALWPF